MALQAPFAVGTQLSASNDDVDTPNVYTDLRRRLSWSATDDDPACQLTYSVYQQAERGPDYLANDITDTSVAVTDTDYDGTFGGDLVLYGWYVSAHDCSGNSVAARVPSGIAVVQENGTSPSGNSEPFTFSGAWQSRYDESLSADSPSGAHAKWTSQAGATATYVLPSVPQGSQLGLVMARGPDHGVIDVSIDGGLVATVDTGAPAFRAREIVLSRVLTKGRHTITIRNRGTTGRPRAEMDALVLGGMSPFGNDTSYNDAAQKSVVIPADGGDGTRTCALSADISVNGPVVTTTWATGSGSTRCFPTKVTTAVTYQNELGQTTTYRTDQTGAVGSVSVSDTGFRSNSFNGTAKAHIVYEFPCGPTGQTCRATLDVGSYSN